MEAEEILEVEEAPEVDDAKVSAEAEAKLLGWRPKEEFVGDADRWRDAGEFLKHGQETLPILRENYKRLVNELREFKGTFKEFQEYHKKTIKKTEDRSYAKAMKDITEEQRKAVEAGDVEKFDNLEAQKKEIPPPIDEPASLSSPAKDPVLVAWEAENDWYGGDSDDDLIMTARAEQLAAVLNNKGVKLDEMLPRIKTCIKKEYPAYFTNQRAQSDAAVGESKRGTGESSKKGGKTFADLPADAKKECQKYVKEGFDQKQYLADYFGEE